MAPWRPMDLNFARRHPVAVHNRFPIAPQEPLAGGAHGAPYVQTIGYAWSRVGCAVRTRVFRRPGCGAPPRRLPEGRGRDGCDREGQGPGEGWPHPAHGPIFATIHPGAMHNLSPHRPKLAPRTVGTRPNGRCAGRRGVERVVQGTLTDRARHVMIQRINMIISWVPSMPGTSARHRGQRV